MNGHAKIQLKTSEDLEERSFYLDFEKLPNLKLSCHVMSITMLKMDMFLHGVNLLNFLFRVLLVFICFMIP